MGCLRTTKSIRFKKKGSTQAPRAWTIILRSTWVASQWLIWTSTYSISTNFKNPTQTSQYSCNQHTVSFTRWLCRLWPTTKLRCSHTNSITGWICNCSINRNYRGQSIGLPAKNLWLNKQSNQLSLRTLLKKTVASWLRKSQSKLFHQQ